MNGIPSVFVLVVVLFSGRHDFVRGFPVIRIRGKNVDRGHYSMMDDVTIRLLLPFDFQHLDFKEQSASGWNAPGRETALAVPFVRGNAQLSHFAQSHSQASLIPTRDDGADPGLVLERFLAGVFGAPELFVRLLNDAGGVDGDGVAFGHGRAGTWLYRFVRRRESRERLHAGFFWSLFLLLQSLNNMDGINASRRNVKTSLEFR